MYERKILRITFWGICVPETLLFTAGDKLLYAFPLEASGGLAGAKSPLSGSAEISILINEELGDATSEYYANAGSTDGASGGDSFLLNRIKSLWGDLDNWYITTYHVGICVICKKELVY